MSSSKRGNFVLRQKKDDGYTSYVKSYNQINSVIKNTSEPAKLVQNDRVLLLNRFPIIHVKLKGFVLYENNFTINQMAKLNSVKQNFFELMNKKNDW